MFCFFSYEADRLSEELLLRKMTLARDSLKLLDEIMPGKTRKRGELHFALNFHETKDKCVGMIFKCLLDEIFRHF